ncbi:MAG: hypothetical protein AB7E47_03195 [Desulfovibrionaceae bacterium]
MPAHNHLPPHLVGMRALSIMQPWAGLIVLSAVDGMFKRVENRTWPAPAAMLGRRFVIHASARPDPDCREYGPRGAAIDVIADQIAWCAASISSKRFDAALARIPHAFACGAILGTAVLSGCTQDDTDPWAMPKREHWHLGDVQALLSGPIPYKGALGFWTVRGVAQERAPERVG